MPYICSYFLNYDSDKWGFVDLNVGDDGILTSMQVGETLINVKSPCIYPAYDNDKGVVFWFGIDGSKLLYRLDYIPLYKTVETAKCLFGPNANTRYKRTEKFPIANFPEILFGESLYKSSKNDASNSYKKIIKKQKLQENEQLRCSAELLSEEDLNEPLTRAPDQPQRIQALGAEEDVVYTQTLNFQKEIDKAYTQKVKRKLDSILIRHGCNYFNLKEALKEHLRSNWQEIKGTPLSYTSLSNNFGTKLLVGIAEKIGEFEGEHAISYLMPDVYTESQYVKISSLEQQNLSDILKTHILDESGRYLLPVGLLIDYTDSADNSLKCPHGFINPYFDNTKDDDKSHMYLTEIDLELLFIHSQSTQNLKNSYQALKLASHDDTTLLGQLNRLVKVLKTNDAHEGIGRQADVGEAVYTVVPEFMRYYRRLHKIGMHVSENHMPTLMEAFGDSCLMGYFLVKSGPDAGLHFMSRYNEDGSLLKVDEPDRETYQKVIADDTSVFEETKGDISEANLPLCDASTPARYPIDVMLCENFVDISELRERLSLEHPTLIRATSDDSGTYHIYGQQKDESWNFTTIIDAGPIVLPSRLNLGKSELLFDNPITQLPANVPEKMYTEIKRQRGHFEKSLMLDTLKAEISQSMDTCSLEHLKLIVAQTGHLDIDEFKQVPEEVRIQLNQIWQYLQDSGKNISATATTETCIGTLREHLQKAVQRHADTLIEIGLSETEKARAYRESFEFLERARDILINDLQSETYHGMEVRAPFPQMLDALNLSLVIRTPDEFRWFCSFPTETINAFLSENTASGPLEYIQNKFTSVDCLSELLLQIPPSAFRPVFEKLSLNISIVQSINLIDFLKGNDDKDDVFLYECLPSLIINTHQLSLVLVYLRGFHGAKQKSSKLIDALKARLPQIIQNALDLSIVLFFLDEDVRNVVIDTIKNNVANIVTNFYKLNLILPSLNTHYKSVVFDAIKDIFKDCSSDMIQNKIVLDDSLQYLTDDQRGVILRAIKGKLYRFRDSNYKDEINACLKNSKQGFFATPRAEAINIGSLSSKLDKYIQSRQKGYSFHWDFLFIKAFFYWLLGGSWVKAKDTKIAAATYALHVYKNEDARLVRLSQLENMPDKSQLKDVHANSYLLVGQSDTLQKLCYVDYMGNTKWLTMKNSASVQQCFGNNTHNCLNYDDIHNLLATHVRSSLPTDVQLQSLKEGLLGDIMTDEEVQCPVSRRI